MTMCGGNHGGSKRKFAVFTFLHPWNRKWQDRPQALVCQLPGMRMPLSWCSVLKQMSTKTVPAKVAAVTNHHCAGTVPAKVAAVAQEQQPNRITRIWLLHDSTTVCKARATTEGGESDRWQVEPYPPYSPDLILCDIGCLLLSKRAILERCFFCVNSRPCKIDEFTTSCHAVFRVPQYLPKMATATRALCE